MCFLNLWLQVALEWPHGLLSSGVAMRDAGLLRDAAKCIVMAA